MTLAARLASAENVTFASLEGRIVDSSGAVVPGAVVELIADDDSRQVAAASDAAGNYAFARVTPGRYTLRASAPGFALFSAAVALAAGKAGRSDIAMDVASLVEHLTVTASAPPRQEVLDYREVRESSARDAGEALARLEGLWKIRKGGIASDVVLRGFQQGNINVLIDGARIAGACPNHMDPPAFHIDFAEVQQVEVTKGAFDLANQGSLGGAVNIVSKAPGRGFRLTPNFSAGSFGYLNSSLTGSLSGETTYALAGYSYRHSRPFVDGSGRPFTDYANFRGVDGGSQAFDASTAWFKLGFAPSANGRLNLAYTRQDGGRTLYPYLQMDAVYDDADRLNARYRWKTVDARAYYTRVNHWMTDEFRATSAGAPRPFGMATFAATKMFGGRVDARAGDFTAGVEGYRRYWNAVNTMRMGGTYTDQPSLPDVITAVGGAYAQYGREIRRGLRLQAGGRVDAAASEARSAGLNTDLYWAYKGTRSREARDANPSGSLSLSWSPAGWAELFAGAARTARLPDPQERYFALRRPGFDWVGNPELQPTRNTEADLGVNVRHRRFTLRPTVFYSRLTDFVIVHNQPLVNRAPAVLNAASRSYTNTAARVYGGEITYTVPVNTAILVLGGVSYVRGTKEADAARRVFSRDIVEMPPLKSRTALRLGTRILFAEIEGIAAGAQRRIDTDLRESPTPGYAILNVKGGLHTRKASFAAGIDNVFDRFYYEHFSYQRDPFRLGTRVPEPGINLYVTVSYAF